MSVRLFLDANILIGAAHNPRSRSAVLFACAERDECRLISSPYAIAEARHNLKPASRLPRLESLLRAIEVCPECSPENAEWAREQGLPAKDAPILGAAAQAGAGVLVTSDRMHFGPLYCRTLRGVWIANAAQALALLLI